jgi:hypothetical protein
MRINFRPVPFILLLIINSLFMIKYGTRFIGPNAYVLAGIMVLGYALVIFLGPLISNKLGRHALSRIFIALVISSMVCSVLVDASVKPYNVKVDRWSAITSWDKKILHGEYPYEARTHLGGIVSGLPGLFLITLPFYFMGDVGYFQAATLLLFGLASALVLKADKRLPVFLLFSLSIGFLWEIFVRSDLAGNAVLVVLSMIIFERSRGRQTVKTMLLCGVILGCLMAIRTVFIIPCAIYLVRWLDFKKTGRMVAFAIASLLVFCLLLFPFIAWDMHAFLSNNPFHEQSDKMPLGCAVCFIAGSMVCGFFVRSFDRAMLASGYMLFGLISSGFLIKVFKTGFAQAYWGHGFDISYFMIALPFLVLSIFPHCVEN